MQDMDYAARHLISMRMNEVTLRPLPMPPARNLNIDDDACAVCGFRKGIKLPSVDGRPIIIRCAVCLGNSRQEGLDPDAKTENEAKSDRKKTSAKKSCATHIIDFCECGENDRVVYDGTECSKYSNCCRLWTVAGICELIMFGIYLTYWNMHNIERFSKSYNEVINNAIFVDNISDTAHYQGRLVHVVGPLTIDKPLTDIDCGFTVSSIKLKRSVHRSRVYTTSKIERCANQTFMFSKPSDIADEIQTTEHVKIGSMRFGAELIEKFNEFTYETEKLIALNNGSTIRLVYSTAGKEGDIYTVVGQLNHGVIEPYRTAEKQNILLTSMYVASPKDMMSPAQNDPEFAFFRRCYIMAIGAFVVILSCIYFYKMVTLERPVH